MTINKTRNNMLFMLASLACSENETQSVTSNPNPMPYIAAISDVSDDETSTTAATSPPKEIVVARRRRRPLKKRRPNPDYLPSSPLLFFGASIKPRKSLLEASVDIVDSSSLKPKPILPIHVGSRDEQRIVPEAQNHNDDQAHRAENNEMPSLVPDDAAWKDVHSPLTLPNFLPCPAIALKHVKSINLAIEQR
mmetsp:Transcript_11431/g.28890  ORF Transcript_11431/g.28890 Transcript_11431/m.28890 type:complete len:193 (+) Transcript_11431:395-973(+)